MDKKLVSLLAVFFISFGIFFAVVVFNKPLTQLTRAKEDVLPSTQSSLILAWPLDVPADGTTPIMVTVFARTETSKPVPNKTVVLTTSIGQLKETSQVTNNEGKAVFTLTSQEAGQAELAASVDGTPLAQKLSVTFK